MWLLEQDASVVEVLYLISTRGQVAESFANIPYKEWPSRDEIESYIPRNLQSDDFAWSPLMPKALQWLNDRQCKMRRKEREEDFGSRGSVPRGR